MPTTVVTTPPTDASEPVSLAELASWLRLDDSMVLAANSGDFSALDPLVVLQLKGLQTEGIAAREACEGFTGRLLAGQTIQQTFSIYEDYAAPLGGTATAVTGIFNSLDDLANQFNYLAEYAKGISVERELPLAYGDGYGGYVGPTYTVTFTIDQKQIPASVKSAIKELTGEWYRNREVTIADVRSITELPANYKVKLAPYRLAPLGNY